MFPLARLATRRCRACATRSLAPRCASAAFASTRNLGQDGWQPRGRSRAFYDAEPRERGGPGERRRRNDWEPRGLTPFKWKVFNPKTETNRPIELLLQAGRLHIRDATEPNTAYKTLWPMSLRDSCRCSKCRDRVSGQKKYVTTEIPIDITIKDHNATNEGLFLTFDNDIERLLNNHGVHTAIIPWPSIEAMLDRDESRPPTSVLSHTLERTGVKYWDQDILEESICYIDYEEYMQGGNTFWEAMIDICRLGIVVLKNVPRDEESVVKIATRIANIKETFYGRTFDVRAKPNPENIAYSSGPLTLHQDLLYLDSIPQIQILHCMDNSCEGGESLFSDGDRVGALLLPYLEHPSMRSLVTHFVNYEYEADGYSYHKRRKTILLNIDEGDPKKKPVLGGVQWSPPFQGYPALSFNARPWARAAKVFEDLLSSPGAVYRMKMQPGDCVLFNNRRVMHGRTEFDAAGGSRWLRGTYIGADDFASKASKIPQDQADAARDGPRRSRAELQDLLERSPWSAEVKSRVEETTRMHDVETRNKGVKKRQERNWGS